MYANAGVIEALGGFRILKRKVSSDNELQDYSLRFTVCFFSLCDAEAWFEERRSFGCCQSSDADDCKAQERKEVASG